MKLRSKLILPPAIVGLLAIALCGVATLLIQRTHTELDSLTETRVAHYAAAYRVQGELGAIHVEVTRFFGRAAEARPEDASTRGAAIERRVGALLEQAERLRASTTDATVAAAMFEATSRYHRRVTEALGGVGSDPSRTGGASRALEGVDTAFRGAAEAADRLIVAERALIDDAREAARVRDTRDLKAVWGLTLLSLLVALGVAWRFNRRLLEPLNAAREAAESIARGDLRVRLPHPPSDEVGLLINALEKMAAGLTRTIGDIKASTEQVAIASREIATGNVDLSRRTEQQAANLQQTSGSITELSATVSANADNARQANQLALGASEVARRGGEVVQQVVVTMGEISESSTKIADIIGVIDGIAFQTNILALNAAVEAARAGEQGRGFAVVAGEVRSLAQRSAEAARQIKGLIADSSKRVESGGRLVEQAGITMSEIVTSVRRVTDIIGEISSATDEQNDGIGKANEAVGELDRMTQQNAALVEQSAAAAESLRQQAQLLAEAVDAFRIEAAGSGGVDRGALRAPVDVSEKTSAGARVDRGPWEAGAPPTGGASRASAGFADTADVMTPAAQVGAAKGAGGVPARAPSRRQPVASGMSVATAGEASSPTHATARSVGPAPAATQPAEGSRRLQHSEPSVSAGTSIAAVPKASSTSRAATVAPGAKRQAARDTAVASGSSTPRATPRNDDDWEEF